jgi:lysozyme
MDAIRIFHPVTGVASAQGLDVSNFQGQYNWAGAVKAMPGLAFGIHRLTQGLGAGGTNSPDPTARWNHQQIRDNGLRRGAYHFLDPRLDGRAQARYFVDAHGQLGLIDWDMLWMDDEESYGLPAGVVAECGAAFLDEVRTLRPHNPLGPYSFISFITTGHLNGLGRWPLWLAYPAAAAPKPPPPWTRWTFWQWGLRNGVDADAFNGTIADLDAWIASFQPPPTPPPVDGLYPHLTDGATTLAALAASRNETVEGFLAQQARMYAQLGSTAPLATLGAAVPPKGLTYYTVHP